MGTHTFAQLQAGYGAAGVWTDTGPGVVQFVTQQPVGIRVSHDGAVRQIWTAPSLALTYTSGVGGSGTLTVSALKRRVAPAWATGNLPSGAAWNVEELYSGTVDLSADTQVSLATHVDQALTTAFGGFLQSPIPGTIFGLVLEWNGNDVVMGTSLGATFQRDLTGIVSPRAMMSRADECPKCGGELFREEMVRDQKDVGVGGGPGQLVCQSCFDPPSPPNGPETRLREVNP